MAIWCQSAKGSTENFGEFKGRGHTKAHVGCGQALFWHSVVLENVLKIGSAIENIHSYVLEFFRTNI